jgi:hypothetical protein
MTHIHSLPPMQYRLWSIQQQIRWCNFAISNTPKHDTALMLYRLNKRHQLRKEEIDVMVQIAERHQMVKILISNEIEFIIIDNCIHLL